ncbi:MAG: hypothetical protein ACR2IA_03250 [Pyrinomonadaceae bacterium]
MRICPKCSKTYEDESLNFCLDDGSVLNQTGSGNALPETVLISQPRPTAAHQPFGNQTDNYNQAVPAQFNSPAKKGSKTWLWVVGILGAVVLICGGGFAGLLALGNLSEDEPKWNSNFGVNSANAATPPSNTNSDTTRTNFTKVDLSSWVQKNSKFGVTEFRGNEFYVNAIKSNFYYVLVAPARNKSANSTTKITTRNVESANYSLGYGLIINSNPTPLVKDYAFLINSYDSKYRIVSHTPGNEKTVVNWKSSASIKSGSQENILEVRDEDGLFKFFINGNLIETVSSQDSYQNGVPGVYVGGTSPVAFSNLEIRK